MGKIFIVTYFLQRLLSGNTLSRAAASITISTQSLVAVLFFVSWASSAQAAIPASERAVLTDLYVSTDGASSWFNKTNWNNGVGTECTWFGITCDSAQSHVTGISLNSNNLVGTLPSLSGLTALQIFEVSRNQLPGSIPSLIGLTALQRFSAYQSRLSGLLPSLSGLAALQHFDVASNQLTGSIPSLSGLTSLQFFYVGGNQLSGLIPSLNGLSALIFFDVEQNQLTGSIPSLIGLTALQDFHVGFNQLSGSIPSLSGLTALRDFHAVVNQLSGSIPSLSGLTALQAFDVTQNQLTGSMPSINGLTTLQDFFVGQNRLSGSIPSLSGLPSLNYFDANYNQLSGSLPSLSALPVLQRFHVRNNSLTGPVSTPPTSLFVGNSILCGNSLVSSGNAAIDAAWVTAAGNWLACQIPAEQTPPVPMDLPENSTINPKPADRAIVITHGWDDSSAGWVKEMALKYCGRLGQASVFDHALADGLTKICQGNNWDVWIMDWRSKANTWLPWNAFTNASERGEALANNLKTKNYWHIHFVAHSAGANLIDFSTIWLKTWVTTESRRPIEIHATFLDAYEPALNSSRYGGKADWADNYVDTREVGDEFGRSGLDGTKLFLEKAYNIDVTPVSAPDPCLQLFNASVPPTILDVYKCRHNRPYRFYGLSVSVDSSFVGHAPSKAADPIPTNGTGAMGYPLSVENGRSLSALNTAYPKAAKCVMNGGICYPGSLPPSALFFLPGAVAGTVVDTVTGAVSYVAGAGTTLFNSIRLGGISPLSGFSIGTRSAVSAATTDSPSWIVVLPTTTQPVNTLRFNWRFAAAGEGFLRVYVNGELVREIDQRHVSIASVTAEEIYIGGAGGTLVPGTHRIAFRLDGFGTSASGVELTGVDLRLTALNAPLDVDASFSATKYHAGTDGLLTLRYLFGLTGTSLTTGVLGGTASRTDPALIKFRLDSLRTSLDIDGNGRADALTDGLLILRYMLGLRGASLITGAVDPLGTRKTATDIETYIQSLMP